MNSESYGSPRLAGRVALLPNWSTDPTGISLRSVTSTRAKTHMRIFILLSLVGLFVCGCAGNTGPEMASVQGTITIDGNPLADAEVVFVSGAFEGYGRTDSEGHYSLVRGAPVGNCKVYVTPAPPAGASQPDAADIDTSIEGMDEEQVRAMAQGAADVSSTEPRVSPDYTDPERTTLSFEVPSSGTDKADFQL